MGQPRLFVSVSITPGVASSLLEWTHAIFYLQVMKRSQASESKLSWVPVPDLSD